MSVNSCTFMGNLGIDPDLRFLPDGRAVVNISIACGEKWKDADGNIQERTEWIRAVCFGKRAEVIGEHFKKGSQIYIHGKMRTRDYEKDGVKHWATEIIIDDFQFCGQKSESGSQKAEQQASAYSGQAQSQPSVQQAPSHDNFDDDYNDSIPF
jgi:single-strand DNA-binding protein